jgi:hypothetical protein
MLDWKGLKLGYYWNLHLWGVISVIEGKKAQEAVVLDVSFVLLITKFPSE